MTIFCIMECVENISNNIISAIFNDSHPRRDNHRFIGNIFQNFDLFKDFEVQLNNRHRRYGPRFTNLDYWLCAE